MSSYYTRYCETHGDWEQDIDRPGDECPECEKAGTTPMQLKDKRIRELEAEVARLEARVEWLEDWCANATAQRVLELEAKLRAVGELPEKWIANAPEDPPTRFFAKKLEIELEVLLNE